MYGYGLGIVADSDREWSRVLHNAAMAVATAREHGNLQEEIHYRKELQRLSNLHATYKTGRAVSETQMTIRDFAGNVGTGLLETGQEMAQLMKVIPPLALVLFATQFVRRR